MQRIFYRLMTAMGDVKDYVIAIEKDEAISNGFPKNKWVETPEFNGIDYEGVKHIIGTHKEYVKEKASKGIFFITGDGNTYTSISVCKHGKVWSVDNENYDVCVKCLNSTNTACKRFFSDSDSVRMFNSYKKRMSNMKI